MKNSLILAIFSIFFINGTPLFANGPATLDAEDQETIKDQIEEHVPFPDFALAQDITGDVEISFTIESDGAITLHHVSGSNAFLIHYTRTMLQGAILTLGDQYKEKLYRTTIRYIIST